MVFKNWQQETTKYSGALKKLPAALFEMYFSHYFTRTGMNTCFALYQLGGKFY